MAAAAILDFVEMSNSAKPPHGTLQHLLGLKIWWKSVKRFKYHSAFPKFKMAAAAILDFVKMSNSAKPLRGTLQHLLVVKIWWKSVKPFKSYSTFSKLKMAVAAILDFVSASYSAILRTALTGSTHHSNLVKIGRAVPKLAYFFYIQYGGRRHLGFC